ncbi:MULTISPECIES: DHH family phosphoesterase [unclassified Colwellia]|uniref:DHH family phosphoesterase n=1 Tax=unclassified Colwellia TaxID=196834 RepID=UPI0015F76817|nr:MULTISPECIES: DHH family phosphoesterase [unclassified Colwellia]MBA6230775.1 DHH family phosphoesterase [Colwellia sp. MB02u-7]MBA6234706.1 DHH family phosphoesterase [Colwellia sp. MB02u-11]MBA6255569.1 DHH family phosphoesterase [Colwellia sp. MB3u-28]MBA6261709.1 DHH family phosphoesterase [Colwellia sp. MB3u-41]MBA6301260.1 DHH family phosphoesterase [Colwellia sp. MB3u-22]
MHYDVFNGDADGIIALVQLRLAQPKKSTLITGVKRDISLLKQVPVAATTSVTVLDISMEKNSDALAMLLENNIDIFYVDHHRSGDIPQSKKLTALINTDANTCTSLLMNDYLKGQFANWAITAAYGDNMNESATKLAAQQGLSVQQQKQLKALGIYINYNGYGRTVDDLHIAPADLFNACLAFEDPLALINAPDSIFTQLAAAYKADMAQAQSAEILADNDVCKVVLLADEAWSRRVSGVFGNELANLSPNKAHAVLTLNETDTLNMQATYTVSLRAPLHNKQGADSVCVQFPTGGGRAGAAGINQLPKEILGKFIATVSEYYA